MNKLKKGLALLLSMTMMITMLTACGADAAKDTVQPAESKQESKQESSQAQETAEPEADKPDISEPVTVTMYLIGDRPVDHDEVFAKINERLSAEINTTVDVKFMGWGEYEQKYPLIFASGEDWDIIYTANWCFYNAQATKQGFYEITREDLEKYAPMSAETMYDEAWEQAKVDGKVYMLPMNYKEISAQVYMARGDLMDKYNITSVSTLDEVEAYLDAIAQNEKSLIPVDIGSDYDKLFMFDRMWSKANWETEEKISGIGPWQSMASTGKYDDTLEIKGNFDQPEFLAVIKRLQDWKNRGFWSRNAVVNTQNNTESFQAGKSALGIMNANTAKSVYSSISTEHPEWDVRVFDAQEGVPAVLNSYLANGMSIFSKSKHPDRALMVLDYLRNDETCHNLFCYGIEGKHWEAAGDDALKLLDASTNYPYDGNCNWGIRNDKYWRTIEGGIPNFNEMYEKWAATAESSQFDSFVFNEENVKNEIAAMNDVFNNEYKLLGLGFTDDPEGDIAKLREKMIAAGAEKVYEEVHNQAVEFLNSQP